MTGCRLRAILILVLATGSVWAADQQEALREASAGLELARQGKYTLAIPHYRSAIAQDPHLPGIYLNLGLAYFKLDDLAKASSAFEHAAKTDPANFQVHALLGMSYFGLRKFGPAA